MKAFAPCEGLDVALLGDSRPLLIAGRLLADLGARVTRSPGTTLDVADAAWTRIPVGEPAPLRGEVADLSLVDGPPRELPGVSDLRPRVFLVGTGSQARNRHLPIGERELAAIAGVAVAVGEPGRPPLPLPNGCLDALVGAHVAAAGMGALLAGAHTVEVAAVDVVASTVAINDGIYTPYGLPWHREGRRASASGGCYPYGLFPARDGYVFLIGRASADWERLMTAAGRPAWSERARYRDVRAMGTQYPDEVDALLGEWLATQTVDDVMAAAAKYHFPAGPVRCPGQVLEMRSLAGWWRQVSVGDATVSVPGVPYEIRPVPGAAPSRSLADLLVVDLSWVWSGPSVASALADLGATVVKVESSRRPDNSRLRGRPAVLRNIDGVPPMETVPYFHAVNRGKLSLTLDFTHPDGLHLLLDLVNRADVFIENLSPGVCDRLGLDPRTVARTNPGCVYLSMPGYPPHPDFEGLRAYAPVLSSGAGIEALVRYPGEDALGLPTFGYADANAAAHGLFLVLSALWARSTGHGARAVLHQFTGTVFANGRNLIDAQLGRLPDGLDPFEDGDPLVEAGDLPRSSWVSNDLFAEVDHPWVRPLQLPRLAWRMDGQFPRIRGCGPALGQDTRRVLGEFLGLEKAEIDRLSQAGALL